MRNNIAAFLIFAGGLPLQAGALVKLESRSSVKESMDRLVATVEQSGSKVVACIDHAASAKAVGMDLAPTELLIFGQPKLGTPLMQANPNVGIDLPLKVLARQDKDGKVWIGYVAPDLILSRHGMAGGDNIAKTMRGALDGLAKPASGQP